MKNLVWIAVLVVLVGCQAMPTKSDYGDGRFWHIRSTVDDSLMLQLAYPNAKTCRVYLSWLITRMDTAKEMADYMTCSTKDRSDMLNYAATVKHPDLSILYVHTKTETDCIAFINDTMKNDKINIIEDCSRVAAR